MKLNELQLPLERSKIESQMNDLDEIEAEHELIEYLETFRVSELIEIYYIQALEISRIRKIFNEATKTAISWNSK